MVERPAFDSAGRVGYNVPVPRAKPTFHKLAAKMEGFEAAKSRANTGTGSRREGAGFERLVGDFWEAVRAAAVEGGATSAFVRGEGRRRWAELAVGDRRLYLPNNPRPRSRTPTRSRAGGWKSTLT